MNWLTSRNFKMPDGTALIYRERFWDFASLNEQIAWVAARLETMVTFTMHVSSMVPEAGDRIGVLMPTRPEYVFLICALARMGCPIVPLNTRLTEQEIRLQLKNDLCRVLVCSAETEARAAGLADTVRHVVSVDDTALDGIMPLSGIEVNNERQEHWRQASWNNPRETEAIIFTSGTTGGPKDVWLKFSNFAANASASGERLGRETAVRWLLCMPLYHVGGLSIVLRCCTYGTTIILQDGFDVAAVSDAIDRDGVSMVSLVPTMLYRLIEHRAGRPFPASLKCVLLGGAAASPKLVAQCIEQNIPIALTYGLTEACSQVATATPDETRRVPGSVGRPLPGTEVRILGDEGAELPAGEIGEIVVSGPTVMRGYLGQPEATASALRDGWLHTGDLGYLDADGFLWPVQRRSDLIVSGGENVYPAEVEAALETHPSVQDVCVVGVEDAEWGQRVAALVVASAGGSDAETLMVHCRARLAGYKCPRIVHFVEALPRTASGKVQRREAARIVEAWLSKSSVEQVE